MVATKHLKKGVVLMLGFFLTMYMVYLCPLASRGKSRAQNSLRFLTQVLPEEYAVMMDILSVVAQTADKANLTYFLFAGSLLGSYRHHGPIPWDDDIDIIFDYSDKYKLRDALKSAEEKGYVLLTPEGDLLEQERAWKVYPRDTGRHVYKISKYPHHWPFLDIFFFKGNSSHIYCDMSDSNYTVARSCVFPLIRRPFGDMMLPAPCNPLKFLQEFDVQKCITTAWDHRLEIRVPRFKISCSKLKDYIPWVSRTDKGRQVKETLKIGTRVLWSVSLPSNCVCM